MVGWSCRCHRRSGKPSLRCPLHCRLHPKHPDDCPNDLCRRRTKESEKAREIVDKIIGIEGD